MVDDTWKERPAEPRDFRRAVENVDEHDLHARTHARDLDRPPVMPGEPGPVATDPVVGQPYERAYERPYDAGPPPAGAVVATEERRTVAPETARPFSIAAGFFGWAVASFFTLVLVTLTLALLGAAAYDATNAGTAGIAQETFNSLTIAGLAGLLVALFVAYLLGGYAAGRIGLWHGVGHGVAVVAWSVLFTIAAVALGAWLGSSAVALYVTPAVDWGAISAYTIGALLVTLLVMLAGAILGGVLGARADTREGSVERRRVRSGRGRPL